MLGWFVSVVGVLTAIERYVDGLVDNTVTLIRHSSFVDDPRDFHGFESVRERVYDVPDLGQRFGMQQHTNCKERQWVYCHVILVA